MLAVSCRFVNTVPAYATTGAGIYGITSAKGLALSSACGEGGVAPNGECVNYNFSLFKGLTYGIKAVSTAGTVLNLDRLVFDNNLRAAYISGATAPVITRCRFNVAPSLSATDTTRGLYLDRCTGYLVTENTFTFTGSNNERTVGLYVKHSNLNTATASNEIYNNTFSGLYCGTIAYGRNRYSTTAGLCYKCNDFSSCNHDIVALKNETGNPGSNTGIAASQGQKNQSSTSDPTLPAGNTFSISQGHLYDLNNNAKSFNYVHHHDNVGDLKIIPTLITSSTVSLIIDGTQYLKILSCPSSLTSGGGSTEEDKSAAETSKYQTDSLSVVLSGLLDAGNTDDLTTEVALSTSPEALAVRDALLQASPYVTDTVMKTAIAKEEVFPNAMVRDVLVANPQSAKEPELLEALDERAEPMPDAMLAEIMQGASLISAKEVYEQKISRWNASYNNAMYKVIRAYSTDTVHAWAADSLFAYLDRVNTAEAKYDLALRFAAEGQSTKAAEQIALAGGLTGNSPEEATLHNQWSALVSLTLQLRNTGLTPDSVQQAALATLADSGEGLPSVYARNLLISFGLSDTHEDVHFPDPEGLKVSRAHKVRETGTAQKSSCLAIQPNPTNDYIIVSYIITKGNTACLSITDMTGKHLQTIDIKPEVNQKVIPLNRYSGGNYFVTLIVDDHSVETIMFTLLK